jgi:hypothetical protein
LDERHVGDRVTFEVIDTIRNLTDADINLVKSLGITGVSRYIAQSAPKTHKIMVKAECDRIRASGLSLMVNYERDEDEWTGGFERGQDNGRWARDYTRTTLGLPDDVCIIQSIDTGVAPADLHVAADYQRGFNDGGGLGAQGVYGPANVLEHLHGLGLVKVCWEWMGEKGAPSSPVSNIRQFRDKPYDLPFTYDVDTPITAFFGQYRDGGGSGGNGSGTAAIATLQLEEEMAAPPYALVKDTAGITWTVDASQQSRHRVSGKSLEFAKALLRLGGFPDGVLDANTNADIQTWLDEIPKT